ncbi:MAG TPA: arylsulfatase [Gemmatimonadaceae bacterium]|nr:arylsulfatase [Gemmatimonadaceae bacterium]
MQDPRPRLGFTLEESVPQASIANRPPAGAPNVVLIVLDDLGFAQLGCFGSDIATPHIDQLAASGLRYNRFHVTALCSPTRACLLTGRNHHAVGMGFLSELALGYPGYTGAIPKTAATLPRILRDAGYATLAVGKWHLAPGNEQSQAGPFEHWPLGLGFERYHGFLTAETNQWAPNLVSDNHFIDPPRSPKDGYHLTEDLADTAIQFVYDVAHNAPGKPFFLYFAPGAMHAPHQVPERWATKYAGSFDPGWDEWRDQTFTRQRALGVVPEATTLTPRPSWVQPWADTDPSRRRLHTRAHEVYAGFLSHTDEQIGRVLAALGRLGVMGNTLVLVISDNGASAEGGPYGTFNNQGRMVGVDDADVGDIVDDWGGTRGYYHYPWAWAWAGNTPFRLWKRYSWLGGTRTPLIVRWPDRISEVGAVRSQFCHAIDLMPTILDACGIQAPTTVDGVTQQRIDGASLLATFDRSDAPSPRETQYFEIVGSRSIISGDWKATTDHIGRGNIWEQRMLEGSRDFGADHWSLFHLPTDFSEAHDVGEKHPEILEQLKERWSYEAGRNNVWPLTDAMHGRAPGQITPPPYPPAARSTYLPGGSPVFDKSLASFSSGARIVASVEIRDRPPQGVLCALGDRTSGFAFYVKSGKVVFAMSSMGATSRIDAQLPEAGIARELEVILAPVGDDSTAFALRADGRALARAVARIVVPPIWQFGGTGLCLGYDRPLSVTDEYEPPFHWSGVLNSITIEVPDGSNVEFQAFLQSALRSE